MAVILTEDGQQVLVDDDFAPVAAQWSWKLRQDEDGATANVVRFDPRTRCWIRMHREVWKHRHHGVIPDNVPVDHIDTNPLNNRSENLRLATISQNNANRKVFKSSVLGVKGVQVNRQGKYVARIAKDGQRRHLGVFTTLKAAADAYDAAARELFQEFAHCNNLPPERLCESTGKVCEIGCQGQCFLQDTAQMSLMNETIQRFRVLPQEKSPPLPDH